MHLQFVAFNSNYKILLLISHSRVLVFLFTHRSPPLLIEELTLSSDTFMCYTCEQLLCYSLLCGLPERNDRNSNYNVVRFKCLTLLNTTADGKTPAFCTFMYWPVGGAVLFHIRRRTASDLIPALISAEELSKCLVKPFLYRLFKTYCRSL